MMFKCNACGGDGCRYVLSGAAVSLCAAISPAPTCPMNLKPKWKLFDAEKTAAKWGEKGEEK